MRVYTRRSQNLNKDQKPFIEPSNKSVDNSHSFFGKSVQRKEAEGGVKKDDEKKDQLQQQNKKLEEDKAQKKEAKDTKEEEQKVQKKENKKEDEKQVQKKGDTKEVEKEDKVSKKAIRMKENDKGKIQKKADSEPSEASKNVEEKLKNSKGKGFELPNDIRKDLENKMKADFKKVRIHTDNEAVEMTKELGALAFTHGNDIYFGEGTYNPNSDEGKKLLVHELTHVIQQSK
ncbi:MAG: DUF4157 domain-containing protein [Spirosomataceae bacterium]